MFLIHSVVAPQLLLRPDRLQRNWVGIDISPKAAELVITRIKKDQGLFQEIVARKDIPERTDVTQLRPYNSTDNKKFLYGEQAGHCNGCETHFEMRNLTIDHIIAVQWAEPIILIIYSCFAVTVTVLRVIGDRNTC